MSTSIPILIDRFGCERQLSILRRLVGAIQPFGGEVLKFIGDGVWAIFPLAARGDRVAWRDCRSTLRRAASVENHPMARACFSLARILVHWLRLALFSRRPAVALNVVLLPADVTAGSRDFRRARALPAGQDDERGSGS
jgi:hypothetical protein